MSKPSGQAARSLNWGGGATPRDRLFAGGSAFSFHQAVRLLSLLYQTEANSGEDEPVPVRFRSRMGFGFPGAEIDKIVPASDDHPAEMIVNFLGLAGAHGPLPAVYTEALLNNRQGALRDFLDIFNHRLILLLYRIHVLHHPELTCKDPSQGLLANHLFSLIGLGRDPDSALRNRMAFPDRSLLHYSGLLAQRTRSVSGLATLLSDYFQIGVEIQEFVGAWGELAEEQCTRLGERLGCNQILGESALLGRRIWEQNAGIVIRMGPLDRETYTSLLPDGERHRSLNDMVRFYLGDEIDFSLRLVLRQDQLPDAVLQSGAAASSSVNAARLGWTSWLKSIPTQSRHGMQNLE